jgi:hypothetical protein
MLRRRPWTVDGGLYNAAMPMDRMPQGPPPGEFSPADADQAATATDPADSDPARRALRVQMLATEHWSLLATRSLSWNEAFSRASMFLSLLTGAVVALALVAQATDFGEGFVLFALLTLPIVLFVGLATYVRLLEINNEDLFWVRGMNRLRSAYLEIDPGLGRWFVTGTTEDAEGVFRTFGAHANDLNAGRFHGLVTTPTTIAFVDAMLAAVLAAIVMVELDLAMMSAAGVGILAFLISCLALGIFGYRSQTMARMASELPARDGDAPRPAGRR